MREVNSLLRTALGEEPPLGFGAADVIARARATRRRRRGLVSAAAVAALGVAAIGLLPYAFASGSNSRAPQALSHNAVTHTASTATKQHTSSTASALQLVAYRGKQLPGYTIKEVPQGYVLQGVSDSVLDVARYGDHSSLNYFGGKLVVMLNDYPGPADGAPVSVNGHPGKIDDTDGVQVLTYSDGTYNVDVQAGSNIHISRDQLVQFAEGITVLPTAQVGHG